ncbi:RagB/SusD family nutrient uptake outer membrane protein [Desertivirga brevis]|uniref:RagB/SusD family nutrient uptake outer membrane protein n=1 Tax=Desertivirga brevis TaxID=2810310 RepID=UPI001A95C2EC|nr:RagB/SusD family nutrient uptake outer membrane protein [Pedobacter sp. SYSU D00873]
MKLRTINIKAAIISFCIAASFASCKDALEETPYSFISPDKLGDSPEAAQLWVNGVKSTFNSGHFFAYAIFNRVYDVDSDDATGPNWAFAATGAGNFQENTDIRAYWNDLFTLVSRANFAISKVSEMTAIDEAAKNNALGELNFYRGWAYFTLVRAFGPVPLYKRSVSEGEDTNPPRASVPEVYAFIIDCLKQSETQLYSRTNPAYNAGTLSQEAAKTMLAKVYLNIASGALSGARVIVNGGQQGSWNARKAPQTLTFTKSVVAGHEAFNANEYFTLARDKAKEVMNVAASSGAVGLFPTWSEVWQKANRGGKEHLWMMYAVSGSENFGNFLTYHYSGIEGTGGVRVQSGGGFYGLSDHWYDLFETYDQRIRNGVAHKWLNYRGEPQWYPRKEVGSTDPAIGYDASHTYNDDDGHIALVNKFYDVSDRTVFRTDAAYPWLRYAETLLIYAEAENEVSSPTQTAVDALNLVRQRSNASAVSVGDFNKETLRSFILEERRRELAAEGSRAWDLRRWGIYLQVMNSIGTVDANGIVKSRQERHLLFPLPITEINGNTNINENNPGW